MIIIMAQYYTTKPRRGEIDATPSGLGYGFLTHCYNPNTPSGLKNGNNLFCYILGTPSVLNTLQKAFAGVFSFEKSRRDENIVENMIEQ
jgi:hypothetical protein